MNTLLFFCLLLISLVITYISNKFFKKTGLIILYTFSCVISYLLTFKYLAFQNIIYNSNSIIYVTMLTSLYLLLEITSDKEVSKIINLGLVLNTFTGIILYITASYTQILNDTVGINMSNVFLNNYRVLIAFPISIFISQKVLIKIYERIKDLYDNLFISTVTTYLAIDLIGLLIYIIISYYNIFKTPNLIKLVLSTYMIRLIITLIYSLFLTLSSIKKVKS